MCWCKSCYIFIVYVTKVSCCVFSVTQVHHPCIHLEVKLLSFFCHCQPFFFRHVLESETTGGKELYEEAKAVWRDVWQHAGIHAEGTWKRRRCGAGSDAAGGSLLAGHHVAVVWSRTRTPEEIRKRACRDGSWSSIHSHIQSISSVTGSEPVNCPGQMEQQDMKLKWVNWAFPACSYVIRSLLTELSNRPEETGEDVTEGQSNNSS